MDVVRLRERDSSHHQKVLLELGQRLPAATRVTAGLGLSGSGDDETRAQKRKGPLREGAARAAPTDADRQNCPHDSLA